MLNNLIRRLIQMVFVMFGISVIVFLIFFATPDPILRRAIAGRNASPEVLAAVRAGFRLRPADLRAIRADDEKAFITGDLTSFQNRGHEGPAAAGRRPCR